MKPRKLQTKAPAEPLQPKDRAYFLALSAEQDYQQKKRNNELAEGRLIESDLAVKACSDIVRQVWLLASNLANTIPARCENSSAEKIRAEIISEMNAAKVAVESYLGSLPHA